MVWLSIFNDWCILVDITIFSILNRASMKITAYSELGTIWKEPAVAWIEYYIRVCLEELGITTVILSSIFWDITLCTPLTVSWRFGGTCRFHLQGRRISQARNQIKAVSKQRLLVSCFITTSARTLTLVQQSHPVYLASANGNFWSLSRY
jgi:hypothetical protein